MFQLNCDEFFQNSDATICTEIRTPQEEFPEHSHDFHELIIVSKGTGQHIINDVPSNLSQNYVCYLSPRDRHLYEQVDNLHLTNILFKKNKIAYSPLLKNILPQENNDPSSWYITSATMKRVEKLLEQMQYESRQSTVDSRLMTEALFQQLAVELSRGRLTSQSNDESDNAILKVIDWIQQNYMEEINVSCISDQFAISSRTLSRRIKQVTNLSFNNYVHRVRINNAMNLLYYSEQSITDIAFQVGYKDSNYFSAKFRRFTNKTPSEFR